MNTHEFIKSALAEDVGAGDYSTLACIPAGSMGKAVLKVKESGSLAGLELAKETFEFLEPGAKITSFLEDGAYIKPGEIAFEVTAHVHTILKAERLVLNCMQRMSGIATLTRQYVDRIQGYPARILDTRKTTPLFRTYEKEAVMIGGGVNHRMGLYDMVMLKDNHIDYAGGIQNAIFNTVNYLAENNLDLKIELETRNLEEVKQVLEVGKVHRIMLDNFDPADLALAVQWIGGKYETEASGGIRLENIESYAASGVDFISVGAIIHHAVSLDLSLKAQIL